MRPCSLGPWPRLAQPRPPWCYQASSGICCSRDTYAKSHKERGGGVQDGGQRVEINEDHVFTPRGFSLEKWGLGRPTAPAPCRRTHPILKAKLACLFIHLQRRFEAAHEGTGGIGIKRKGQRFSVQRRKRTRRNRLSPNPPCVAAYRERATCLAVSTLLG